MDLHGLFLASIKEDKGEWLYSACLIFPGTVFAEVKAMTHQKDDCRGCRAQMTDSQR